LPCKFARSDAFGLLSGSMYQLQDKGKRLGRRQSVNFGGELDRRESNRFPLSENVQYRVINNRSDRASGIGRTLDMSSSGIYFTTEGPLNPGRTVEIAVDWPARLDGICPLRFVAVGRVVRAESRRAALRIDRYEFRTRRAAAVQRADFAGSSAGY